MEDVEEDQGFSESVPCYAWSPKASALIVDAQGCTLKKDFFVKELAFYNTLTKEHWVGTFKPPMERSYLRKKYIKDLDRELADELGLEWEQGTFPYQVAFAMINYFGKSAHLYALGKKLCQWILQCTSLCVVILEELGCPNNINHLPPSSCYPCLYHDSSRQKTCALDRAMCLGLYLTDMFSFNSGK